MLRNTCLYLTRNHSTVSVVGRNSAKLQKLHSADAKINPISANYVDTSAFVDSIEKSVTEHGPVTLAVCWIHDTAPQAALLSAQHLAKYDRKVDFYHVLGSESSRPDSGTSQLRDSFSALSDIFYHQVILGFIINGKNSRWLTNEEIFSGVNRAIDARLPLMTVGTTEPWDMRP